jgi:hypothetical protein
VRFNARVGKPAANICCSADFAVIYLCDIDEVPDFNSMYELYDTMTIMFFYRNKHMMCDFGTGNNNKLNWVLEDKQELIDIIETIYKGAKKGRGLVVSPKGKITRPLKRRGWCALTTVQITRRGTDTKCDPARPTDGDTDKARWRPRLFMNITTIFAGKEVNTT